jgi:hypothetical protein
LISRVGRATRPAKGFVPNDMLRIPNAAAEYFLATHEGSLRSMRR